MKFKTLFFVFLILLIGVLAIYFSPFQKTNKTNDYNLEEEKANLNEGNGEMTIQETPSMSPEEKTTTLFDFDPHLLSWEEIKPTAIWERRDAQAGVVFQDKIWILGGLGGTNTKTTDSYSSFPHYKDVWVTEDGENWELITNNAPWGARYDLAAEVFNDKLFVTGGVVPGEWKGMKDVWFSNDGINWELANKESPWPGRHGLCLTSYNNYLWVIGGWSGYGKGYNDVWFSQDGKIWEQTLEDSLWPGREDLTCVVFQDHIWLMGGMTTNGTRKNDIWRSTISGTQEKM